MHFVTTPICDDVAMAVVDRALADPSKRPTVASFFDPATASVTHVLSDPGSRAAMIVDPVLDFDGASGRTTTRSIEIVLEYVREHELDVEWILDTHVHADHISAAVVLRERLGARIGIGRHVLDVHDHFADLFDLEGERDVAFDRLLADGDRFALGGLECVAMHVPGHTPADMAFVVGDAVLTGDTLFMPDFGTARADFPGGDAAQLYRSSRRLLSLPSKTRLLHCHDYPPAARGTPAWTSTVADQRAHNVHVRDGTTEEAFVAMRTARDATLATPALMLASLQVNMRGGQLPSPSANGRRYLKIPLDAL